MAVVVAGLLVGGLPLLGGAPGGDDAYYHAMYALEHARCWRAGVVLPTWYPDLNAGLGGPEPRARPQLPLALGAVFTLLLDDAVAATSLATLLVPAVAGLVMLLVARRRGLSAGSALLAGVAWCASPYLVITLHERAALQEAWAVALLPWLFDALLPPSPASRREALRGALPLAVLLATQLLVAFMAGIIVFVAHALWRDRRSAWALGSAGLAAGLAAVSWVPNVLGLHRLQSGTFASGWFDWRQRFLLSASDPAPLLNRHLTLVAAALAVAAIIVAVERGRARLLAAGCLAALLLATPLAAPLWGLAPGFSLLQFPWRWLGPASALAALGLVSAAPTRRSAVAALVFVLPLVGAVARAPRLSPGPPLRPGDVPERAALAATRYGVPAILPSFPAMLPRGVDLIAALRAAKVARQSLPTPLADGPRVWAWRTQSASGGLAVVPLLADDGWSVEVDGRRVGWTPSESLVAVAVGPGAHRIEARQTLLPEDVAGVGLTIAAVVGLAAASLLARRSRAAGKPR